MATILFGSRARGDHYERRSDINILLISEKEVPLQQWLEFRWDAGVLAQREYKRTVSVPLVVFTPEVFQADEPYINSLGTRAILEGVVISEHPRRFRSRYLAKEPPAPAYKWDDYRWDLGQSRRNLRKARSVLAQTMGDQALALKIYPERPSDPLNNGKELDYRRARDYMVFAMRNALEAAIRGAGEIPKQEALVCRHMEQLGRLVQPEDLSTHISIQAYMDGWVRAKMNPLEFTVLAAKDVEQFQTLAIRLKMRTERGNTGAPPEAPGR